MDNFHDMLVKRHSIRKYTDEDINPDDVKTILEAALLAPTSKNGRPWQFTVVDDKEKLEVLSHFKPMYATSVARCALAIVVSADPVKSEAWIEDASIAATFIQLQAEVLGLGSCWVQVRGRQANEEIDSSNYIKDLLNIDGTEQVLCVITIGHKAEERKPANLEKLLWERVHIGEWK
jgi:nitroreductase